MEYPRYPHAELWLTYSGAMKGGVVFRKKQPKVPVINRLESFSEFPRLGTAMYINGAFRFHLHTKLRV